ncbi:MAG: DUF4328 domain-containing protein [Pseudoxanthomonas sp.]
MDNPYASPATMANSAYDPALPAYKPADTLTRWARLLVGASAAMFVASLFESLYKMGLIDQLRANGLDVDDFYLAIGTASTAFLLLLVLALLSAYVVSGCWIYRMAHNARVLAGGRQLRSTPLGAVGWYFVPLFNLWKPYQALKDVWLASHPGPADRNTPGALLPTWWTLWLISSIIGNASGRAAWKAETLAQEYAVLVIGIAEAVVTVAASIAFIRLIGRLQAAQVELKAARDADQTSSTPPGPT